MENTGDWDRENVIIELTQGRELARQLHIHLNLPSSSHETRELKSVPGSGKQVKVCTKRRSLQKESVDDGYSWRKYGEKVILGARYPRSYYRCTHRNVQGCEARKQVHRSDDDPPIFEITYIGRHTCTQNQEPNQSQDHLQQNQIQRQNNLIQMAEELYTNKPAFASFSSPSTSVNKPDNFEFLPSMLHNDLPAGPQRLFSFPSMLDNHLPWEIPSVSMISSSVGSISV
nr:WRKY [Loropetalum chinense var. rubrum]